GILLLMSGCALNTPTPSPKKDLQTLQDVQLHVGKNGRVAIDKKYSFDVSTNKHDAKEQIKKVTAYERVPLFDKGYKKQL
ncbi:MAG: hypothetical protein L3J44_04235, partial [Campylobacteraceae bacterium]|nr:hypothetical protein [Campylobacteraceae bacterium]